MKSAVGALRVVGLLLLLVAVAAAADIDIRDFGAKGDGVTKDTAAIQRAIDQAARSGGGTVVVPAGRYLCGTIQLRSHTTLELRNGATLLGSPDKTDYAEYEKLPYPVLEDEETTYFHHALVTGEDLDYVAVTGQGVIDGNRYKRGGPKTVALNNCRHVSIRGITVQNSANYSLSFLGCDWVDVDGVTVLNSQADGIDPDNCRYVRISNCFVESRDDAICPKASMALGRPGFTEGVAVTNCVIRTNSANFKLGTESAGTFHNIAFSNSVILPKAAGRRSTAGFEISMVDGGSIEDVVISNISMQGASAPFFIRLGNRGRGQATPQPGILRGVLVDNLVARGAVLAASVTGLPSHPVRDLMLHNILIEAEGGGSGPVATAVPEMPAVYPKAWMFGQLPAVGLFVRHVDGLTMSNVRIKMRAPDARPAMLFDDVKEAPLNAPAR
ncbi:MAG: glycosyl hydrolase family 28-related protein [Bryobacteraceae bacterium]